MNCLVPIHRIELQSSWNESIEIQVEPVAAIERIKTNWSAEDRTFGIAMVESSDGPDIETVKITLPQYSTLQWKSTCLITEGFYQRGKFIGDDHVFHFENPKSSASSYSSSSSAILSLNQLRGTKIELFDRGSMFEKLQVLQSFETTVCRIVSGVRILELQKFLGQDFYLELSGASTIGQIQAIYAANIALKLNTPGLRLKMDTVHGSIQSLEGTLDTLDIRSLNGSIGCIDIQGHLDLHIDHFILPPTSDRGFLTAPRLVAHTIECSINPEAQHREHVTFDLQDNNGLDEDRVVDMGPQSEPRLTRALTLKSGKINSTDSWTTTSFYGHQPSDGLPTRVSTELWKWTFLATQGKVRPF